LPLEPGLSIRFLFKHSHDAWFNDDLFRGVQFDAEARPPRSFDILNYADEERAVFWS
jgi:hypothetical protein